MMEEGKKENFVDKYGRKIVRIVRDTYKGGGWGERERKDGWWTGNGIWPLLRPHLQLSSSFVDLHDFPTVQLVDSCVTRVHSFNFDFIHQLLCRFPLKSATTTSRSPSMLDYHPARASSKPLFMPVSTFPTLMQLAMIITLFSPVASWVRNT